jgi:hypothetical protein
VCLLLLACVLQVAQIYMQEFQKLGVPLHPGIANIAEQQV